MNIALMEQTRDHIVAEYGNFHMGWFRRAFLTSAELIHCRSTMCIGGTAAWLNGDDLTGYNDSDEGRVCAAALDLTKEQSAELFHSGHWDEPYRTRFAATENFSLEAAQVAAEYIDYFMAKHAPLAEYVKAKDAKPVVTTVRELEEVMA